MSGRNLGMGKLITKEEFSQAKRGNWNFKLIPTKYLRRIGLAKLKIREFWDWRQQ